ncbi:CACTIN, partial [Symbiodinium sp. KB8]
MYKKLRVNDEGMFKEVLRRVRRELEKFPNNPTKFPILLLEVHREVVGGVDAMKLVSTTAKTLATDGVDQAPTHVIVSCSSAAFALAFDAGGSARQQDVWVGGFTEHEAQQLAKFNGCGEDDWPKIQPIVAKCDYRAGDVLNACEMLKKGMAPADIEADFREMADKDAVGQQLLMARAMNQERS